VPGRGTATLVFVNSGEASVAVTGQTGIAATDFAEAFAQGDSNGDHSADEHLSETLRLRVSDVVAGVGFTVRGEIDEGTADGDYSVRWVWRG